MEINNNKTSLIKIQSKKQYKNNNLKIMNNNNNKNKKKKIKKKMNTKNAIALFAKDKSYSKINRY